MSKNTKIVFPLGDTTTDKLEIASRPWVESKGYLTQHQSLEDYVKKSELPDVSNYMPLSGGTFTGNVEVGAGVYLGTLDSPITRLYASALNGPIGGMYIRMGNSNRFFISGSGIRGASNGDYDLGTSAVQWGNAYIMNIYENGTLLSDKYAPKSMMSFDSETNTLYITTE